MLSEYLDRELPDGDCEALDLHIQACAPCVAFVDSLRKSVALGRAYAPETATPRLDPQVKQSLKEAYDRMQAAARERKP